MTATTTRQSTSRPVPASMGAPALPQVNLLPPEVKAARTLVHVKQWLGLSLVMVVIIAALGYGGALLTRMAADSENTDAQAEAAQLRTEEAKYAEVPKVVNALRRSEQARTLGMAPEVLWKPYIDALAAVLPPNVGITNLAVTSQNAAMAPASAPDPTALSGVGSITFTATARALPDSAAWLDALNSIPGFYGATMSTETMGTVGTVDAYTVNTTVQVNSTAFAHRFPAAAAGANTQTGSK